MRLWLPCFYLPKVRGFSHGWQYLLPMLLDSRVSFTCHSCELESRVFYLAAWLMRAVWWDRCIKVSVQERLLLY